MKRAAIKERIATELKALQLSYYWQDKPCRLFVVVSNKLMVFEPASFQSRANVARAMGRIAGWRDMLSA